MAVHDFRAQRLYCDHPLHEAAEISCTSDQSNYLINTLRMALGDEILVFNGRQGEWRAEVSQVAKKSCSLRVRELIRDQAGGPDIAYYFAPLKRARLDYLVQKATEMGVASIQPVYTAHTVPNRVNMERLQANVIEAAEQCGVLRVPAVSAPEKLSKIVSEWDPGRRLVFADEEAEMASPISVLEGLRDQPCALIIGPEGGFSSDERSLLLRQPFTTRISLGPRIMRADTAAVAALALINAVIGDWN